jgi:DNA invertase Pin-like site-specific DNA recombinase
VVGMSPCAGAAPALEVRTGASNATGVSGVTCRSPAATNRDLEFRFARRMTAPRIASTITTDTSKKRFRTGGFTGTFAALLASSPSQYGTARAADRLARDVLTAALVERLCERVGASVASANGTGNGDTAEAALMRTLLDAFAAYDRALIRGRTKAALALKKARGERTGGIPYGFAVTARGQLLPHPEEQATVTRARVLRAEGKSLRQVAAALVAEERRPRNGGGWAIQTIRRIVAG